MYGSRCLNYSEAGRPFWLLVAIAIVLLVSVSSTIAKAAPRGTLVETLKRDIGAIRAQLERGDPLERDPDGRSATFNTDLGDGGPTYRRQSLATIVHAARRRGDRLLADYQNKAAARQVRLAEALLVQLLDLQQHIDRYGQASNRASARSGHEQVESLLDQVERTLEHLGSEPAANG